MATYVVLAKFTDQGIRNSKDSPKRAEAFKQMAETFGVTVKELFWTQGQYDIVTIVEAPDEISVVALNLSVSAPGNIRTHAMPRHLARSTARSRASAHDAEALEEEVDLNFGRRPRSNPGAFCIEHPHVRLASVPGCLIEGRML